MRRTHQSQRYDFERLENRSLLAGNVTASVVDNCLVICGDESGNAIAVTQLGNGDWTVVGSPKIGKIAATTVNGGSLGTYSNVECIRIDMKGGDDIVGVFHGSLPGLLSVDTGDGKDIVALIGLRVGSANVSTGNQTDALVVAGLEAVEQDGVEPSLVETGTVPTTRGGTVCLDTGDATDLVLLAGIKAGRVKVNSGAGNDLVGLLGVCVDTCLEVDTGSGKDILGVFKSTAPVAKINGGSSSGDMAFTGANKFGQTSSDYKVTIKADALVKAITPLLNTAKKTALSVVQKGLIPDFKLV